MKLVGWIIAMVALVGVYLWQHQKKVQEEMAERAMEQRRIEEKKEAEDRQRTAMKTFAEGMRKHHADGKKAAERELTTLRADSAKFSEAISKIMAEKTKKGEDQKYETKLLHILQNADVNASALKYLGSDFTGTTAEYIARVREAYDAEAKYAAAVKSVDAAYDETMKRSAEWAKMTAAQRDAEFARLNKEISRLEAKRAKEQQEYKNISKLYIKGDAHMAREHFVRENVIKNRLADVDSEIAKRRRQIDQLRHPAAVSGVEAQMTAWTQRQQDMATSNRRNAMYDIDRRLKPKKTLVDIVAEVEANTVGKIRTAITGKIAEAEKNVKEMTEKLTAVEEFLLSVPVESIQELTRRKAKLK